VHPNPSMFYNSLDYGHITRRDRVELCTLPEPGRRGLFSLSRGYTNSGPAHCPHSSWSTWGCPLMPAGVHSLHPQGPKSTMTPIDPEGLSLPAPPLWPAWHSSLGLPGSLPSLAGLSPGQKEGWFSFSREPPRLALALPYRI
jgi:hypothetical protein